MVKRAPSAPPTLPGYRPIRHLGSGGFADVFLYQQELPHREVAVKVLIEDAVNAESRQRFITEANAMAQLSAHPSIVTIHFAGVAPDGRPCLVMEYCPRPNLGVRMRKEQIPIDEVLRIGVRLASAVETAHRAGILHRDLKPANVLVTAYGWPKLTDFGIAAQMEGHDLTAEGMSVPWSAPELFAAEPQSNVRTDVYALGATIYGLLAGRSPFEVRGGDNSAAGLIARIERQQVPSTGRDDAPLLLQQTLTRAMHKRAEARYRSAYDFARGLRVVESELGLPPTPIEVLETATSGGQSGDDPAVTRVRPVVTIYDEPGLQLAEDSTGTRGDRTPARGAPYAVEGPYVAETSSGRGRDGAASGKRRTPMPASHGQAGAHGSGLDPLPDSTQGGSDDAVPRRSVLPVVLGIIGVLAIAAVVVGVIIGGPDAEPAAEPTSPGNTGGVVRQEPVAPPGDYTCTVTGRELTCSWTQPEGATVTAWRWQLSDDPERSSGTVDEPEVTLTIPEGATPCIRVSSRGESGAVSPPKSMCAG